MFTELVIVRILDFMKVVFVQLPYETREIRMLKHPRQDRFREFVHVLQLTQALESIYSRKVSKCRKGTHFDNETVS